MNKLRKTVIAAGCLLAVVILLMVTCPTPLDHRQAVQDSANEIISQIISGEYDDEDAAADKDADDNDNDAPADDARHHEAHFGFGMQLLGQVFISKLVDEYVRTNLKYQDYMVCSVSYVTVDGKRKILSFGICNHVFTTFTRQDIRKANLL